MSDPKFRVERADLTRLPFRALAVVAKVIESGDRKYQAGDWIMAEQRIDGRRDLNSALRHIGEFIEGKDVDEDSGESPLAHAAARLLFLLEREARGIKGGGWRIRELPLAAESDPGSPDFRLPLTPRVCGAAGGDGRGHVALCGLDKGHPWPHRFTVPDITDECAKSETVVGWGKPAPLPPPTQPIEQTPSPSGEAWDPIAFQDEVWREINRTPPVDFSARGRDPIHRKAELLDVLDSVGRWPAATNWECKLADGTAIQCETASRLAEAIESQRARGNPPRAR